MKKSLILSVVCLLAAVLTTTTASAQMATYIYPKVVVEAEADGVWVKNYDGFPKSTDILRIRIKDNVGISESSIIFSESVGGTHNLDFKKFRFDKTKIKDIPIDANGWRILKFENPLHISSQNNVNYNDVQFFINDEFYKKRAVTEYLNKTGETPEALLNVAAFYEDSDISHLDDTSGALYSYSTKPQLAAEYRKRAADKQVEIERKTREDEQKRLAEEKRKQEEAERAAKIAQEDEAFKKKYGITDDEKGERFKGLLRGVIDIKPTDYSYASANAKLGRMLMEGEGCKKNYTEALKHLKAAYDSDNKNELACYSLGHMYWSGLGVQQNRAKAASYYSCPSAIGSSKYIAVRYMVDEKDISQIDIYIAEYRLALMYEQGVNGVKEIDKAINIFAGIAATQFQYSSAPRDIYGSSAYKYAYYLEQGRTGSIFGFPDIKKAREYYHKAFEYGDAQTKAKAKQALDRIGH